MFGEGSSSDEPSFASTLETLLASSDIPSPVTDPHGIWIHVDASPHPLPPRGWKLHVSATPFSAEEVLRRCVPILIEEVITFKVASSMKRLIDLNEGVGGLAQVGKFITAYPRDPDLAVRVAVRLDEVTQGLRGPRVPSDRSLSPASLVHYRFAEYLEPAEQSDGPRTDAPPDPFVEAGVVEPVSTKLIAGRYLITANLHRSTRGAVHLAVDAPAARTCVLKRAWRDAAVMPDGRDARDRLRQEASILQRFASDPHFPAVLQVFDEDLDTFMAMEHVEGGTFAQCFELAHQSGTRPGSEELARLGLDLCAAVSKVHAAGFIHRDLNPLNVLVRDDGTVVILDFELAVPPGTRHASYAAGTEGFMSQAQTANRAASAADDIFGIGALLFLAATGDPPAQGIDAAAARRALGDREPALPEGSVSVIAACLDGSPGFSTVELLQGKLDRALIEATQSGHNPASQTDSPGDEDRR